MPVSMAHEFLFSEHTNWFGLIIICHDYGSMVQLAEGEKANDNPKREINEP